MADHRRRYGVGGRVGFVWIVVRSFVGHRHNTPHPPIGRPTNSILAALSRIVAMTFACPVRRSEDGFVIYWVGVFNFAATEFGF